MTRFIPGASEVDSISKFKRMLMGKKQQKTKSRGSSLSGIRCRISWTSSLPLPKRVTILNLGYSYREESGKKGEQNRKKLVKLTPFKVKVVKVASFKVKVMELKEVKNTIWSSTGTLFLQKHHQKQGQTVFGTAALPETKPLDPLWRKKSEVSGPQRNYFLIGPGKHRSHNVHIYVLCLKIIIFSMSMNLHTDT